MFERKAELLNISLLLWIMVFGWRRRPRAGRTWLLHRLLSSNQWARLNLQASKSTGSFQWGCLSASRAEKESFLSLTKILISCHFKPTGSSSQSFPALGWLLFLHWDLLCGDASSLLSFYVLVINSGPQLFQLSFSMSMPIILNLVFYLYLVHFYLVYSLAWLSRLF